MLAASPTSVRANRRWPSFPLTGDAAERDVVMGVLHAVAADHPAVRELDRRFPPPPPYPLPPLCIIIPSDPPPPSPPPLDWEVATNEAAL